MTISTPEEKLKVIVVGAGICGLACGAALREFADVTVSRSGITVEALLIRLDRFLNPSARSRSLEQQSIWPPTLIDWFRTGAGTCINMVPSPIETFESTPKVDTSNTSESCLTVGSRFAY
jgi:hypothetical protein